MPLISWPVGVRTESIERRLESPNQSILPVESGGFFAIDRAPRLWMGQTSIWLTHRGDGEAVSLAMDRLGNRANWTLLPLHAPTLDAALKVSVVAGGLATCFREPTGTPGIDQAAASMADVVPGRWVLLPTGNRRYRIADVVPAADITRAGLDVPQLALTFEPIIPSLLPPDPDLTKPADEQHALISPTTTIRARLARTVTAITTVRQRDTEGGWSFVWEEAP